MERPAKIMDNPAKQATVSSMETPAADWDYLLQPEAAQLLDRFTALFGVRLGFFSPDGQGIFIGRDRRSCAYCRRLRRRPEMDRRCRAQDRRMFAAVRQRGRPIRYTCHGGLTEAVLPLEVAGRRIGFIMVGQFRTAPSRRPPPNVRPTPALRRDYSATPVFSEARTDDLLYLLERLVHFIGEHALIRRRNFDLLQPLIEAAERRPAPTWSLAEAARRIGRSPSSVSHLFKSLTGMGYRRFQIERKLDAADRLLREQPRLPVKLVAARCGFDDPLYFSRLYRRRRGRPPSAARDAAACSGAAGKSTPVRPADQRGASARRA